MTTYTHLWTLTLTGRTQFRGAYDVLANATLTADGGVTKTGGENFWWDAYGFCSHIGIDPLEGGHIEWTMPVNSQQMDLTLVYPDWHDGWDDNTYNLWGFYLHEMGFYKTYSGSSMVGDWVYFTAGSRFKVSLEGGVVKCYVNDALVYTAPLGPHGKLYPLVALSSASATAPAPVIHGKQIYRLTSHSTPLLYQGVVRDPAPLQTSTLEEEVGLAPNQIELQFSLGGAGMTEANIAAGDFDRAQLQLDVIDFMNLGNAPIKTWKGMLTSLTNINGDFIKLEFMSKSMLLQQQTGDVYSPTCRVETYGDSFCKKDITSETFTGAVSAVTSNRIFTIDVTQADDYFQYGLITFTSGENYQLSREVKTNTAGAITLVDELPFDVKVGDTVSIKRGCPRTWDACLARDNTVNFRGEPSIPGVFKLLKRFPD